MLNKDWLVRREWNRVYVPFICSNVIEYANGNELTDEEVESIKYLIHQNRDIAECYLSDQDLMYDLLKMADKLEAAIARYI